MKGYTKHVRRVLGITLALNLAVSLAKLSAGALANSLAVIGDGLHSGVDAAGNIAALIVLHWAAAPPDEDHPYGHHKYETLAAFLLGALLLLTAFELAERAVLRMLDPQVATIMPLTVGTMLATLAVNLGVSAYERHMGRKHGSELLLADAAHTRSDVYVTLGVLGGLALSPLGIPFLDPLLALGIAAFIAYTSWHVFRDVIPVLTDRVAYDPVEVARIVREVPGVQNVHDIRSRGPAREAFIQMHLVVDPDDVAGAHAIADEVERRLSDALGVKEVFIHIEPEDDASGPPGSRGEPQTG